MQSKQLLTFLSLALGISGSSIIPGYEIVDIEWAITSAPGKQPVALNGTVQDVVSKLLELDPSRKAEDFQFNPTDVVERADPSSDFTVDCFNFPSTEGQSILSGIKYLQGLDSQGVAAPTNGPGPGNCGRVSCSYDAAIYWCNDNPTSYTLDSWTSIANGASAVYNGCHKHLTSPFVWMSAGQGFNPNNWNVIVRSDNC